jgi:RNA polymerase sigma-70 factor (ECF subfamily)
MTNLIDSYLLFRIRTKRDAEAFARIYDRYVEAIYRFAYLKLPGKEDAQDITAETFTRAWQYLNEAKQVVHIRAFLYQIARNLIVDFYRVRKQEPSVEELVTLEETGTSTDSMGAVEESVRLSIQAERAEPRAEVALIFSKLSRLKEDYRDVLTLRLIDDLPFAVIGEILEKSTGNVRVIYHRGLKALKELS